MQKAHYSHLTFRAPMMPAESHWRLEERKSAAPVIKKEHAAFPGSWSCSKLLSQELCVSQIIALIRSEKYIRETAEKVI